MSERNALRVAATTCICLTNGATGKAGPSFSGQDVESPSSKVPRGESVASPREIDLGERAVLGGHAHGSNGEPKEPPSIAT